MDSLRNLSTSLPRTTPSTSRHELLSAFKAAALQVTTLYKTAASDSAQARAAGYQDALDDLLTFLDRENLGLGVDGEGWRVRQWATQRFNGNVGDHDDDEDEEQHHPSRPQQQESRQESPEVQRKQEPQHHPQDLPQSQPTETLAASPTQQEEEGPRVEAVPTPEHNPDMFTFRSSLPYPSGNHDRDTDMEATNLSSDPASSSPSQNPPPMTVNLMSRQRINRHSHRHAGNISRNSSINTTSLGGSAGSKRKVPDFFDLSGFGGFGGSFGGSPGGKDSDRSSGGGKRGRHA